MSSVKVRLGLPVLTFASSEAFGEWIAEQPMTASGIWLRLAKKCGNLVTLSKPEAIDIALCHGWIDGQQHPFDAASWLTRFTPRRPRSRWSQINRTRALELIALGRMQASGLAEVRSAQAYGRWDAAYAPASKAEIPADLQASLDTCPDAAAVFDQLSKANRYVVLYRLATMKRQKTRTNYIAALLSDLRRDGAAPSRSDDSSSGEKAERDVIPTRVPGANVASDTE